MARIKYVINERRLAYEGAVKILESRRQAWVDENEAKEAKRKQRLARKRASKQRLTRERASKERSPRTPQIRLQGNHAEDLAAAGLFASPTTKASQSAKQS